MEEKLVATPVKAKASTSDKENKDKVLVVDDMLRSTIYYSFGWFLSHRVVFNSFGFFWVRVYTGLEVI